MSLMPPTRSSAPGELIPPQGAPGLGRASQRTTGDTPKGVSCEVHKRNLAERPSPLSFYFLTIIKGLAAWSCATSLLWEVLLRMTRKGSATGTWPVEGDHPTEPEGVSEPPPDLLSVDEIKAVFENLLKPLAERLDNLDDRLRDQEMPKSRRGLGTKASSKIQRKKADRRGKKPTSQDDPRTAPGTPSQGEEEQEDEEDPPDSDEDPPGGGGGDGGDDDDGGGAGDPRGGQDGPDENCQDDDQGEGELKDFCPYTKGNPYKRPLQEREDPSPHDWELSETPGCSDYKIALDAKDKSQYEIRCLHATLSYFYDACEDLASLRVDETDSYTLRRLVRLENTLHGIFTAIGPKGIHNVFSGGLRLGLSDLLLRSQGARRQAKPCAIEIAYLDI